MKFTVAVLLALASVSVAIGHILGGFRSIDVNNEQVQNAFRTASLSISSANSDDITFGSVLSAEYKVIAGIQYRLQVNATVNGHRKECTVIATYRADMGTWATPQHDCSEPQVVQVKKRSARLLGGAEDLDKSDKYVQEAANWAVDHINRKVNSMNRLALQKIAEGTRQVVNGYKYRFLLYLVSTNCRNNQDNLGKTLEDCPAERSPMRQQCDVTVLFSERKYKMLNMKCKSMKHILGGDDHDYRPHGKQSLIGGDGHDYLPHGKRILIGGDGHDYRPHGKRILIGGDDHDYKPHSRVKKLLGGGDHDYLPHGIAKKLFGGDSHDYQQHGDGLCKEHRSAFEEFKLKHGRVYSSPEAEGERFQIFCGNMEKVKEYQKMDQGSAVYGATQFADMSETEFKNKYLGWKQPETNIQWPAADIPEGDIPESFDWRDYGAVTPVKNQGTCGSCWAFSATGNIEGLNAIKHKKLVSLSEQELLDCDKVDLACNGGLPSNAYAAIMKLGGIESEGNYSYEAEKETCKFSKSKVAVRLSGAVNISQNENDMAAWLVKNGPISIGINAFAMQFYFGGISHPWKIFCNPKSIDHGVLIVGYGKEGNKPYWIIKNSWGPNWGRKGYYYVYRGDGTCGLNTVCTSSIVK